MGCELEGGLGFGAGVVGGAAALADLGDAGVGGGVVGVGGEGGVELLLGFGDEALGEVLRRRVGSIATARSAGGSAAIWMARIWSSWKATWRKEASDQVRRMRVVGSKPSAPMMDFRLVVEPWVDCEAGEEFGGFGVVGVELERGLDLARGAGDVAAAEQGDGEVEVVVGVVGVGGDDLLEERDGVLALAAVGDALVVDDFGQRQAAGDEGEGGSASAYFAMLKRARPP